MANFTMDDPEYWEAPERLQSLASDPRGTGQRTAFRLLGPDADSTPLVAILDMPPGHVIPRHAHSCERFEVVVRGSIDVGDRVLWPGDIMLAKTGEFYGPKVVGPLGCTTVEVFSTQAGVAGPILHELVDGTVVGVNYHLGEAPPEALAGMEDVADRVAAVLLAAAQADRP